MVGINAFYSKEASSFLDRFSDAQMSMLHFPSYSANILFEDEYLLIGSTAFEHYPVVYFEDDTSFIVLEGMIYNSDDHLIRQCLIEIAKDIQKEGQANRQISDFLQGADGEFLVIIYNKLSNDLCVFNDSQGRLPFFYYRDEGSLIISREIKFMYPFINQIEFDRIGIMEYLLYGFGLGGRTLIRGIKRLLPASVIYYRQAPLSLSIEQVLSFSFEPGGPHVRKKTSKEHIQALRNSFIGGLQNRVERLRSKTPLILLSGGLDSRATLAGLTVCGVCPRGITYDASQDDKSELMYTKEIADLSEIPLIYLTPNCEVDVEEYVRVIMLFDGALPMDIAHVVNLEEQIAQREGSDCVIYTGLYGGEMFRFLNVTSGLNSDDDLVDFLLSTPDSYHYNNEKVCAMLQISEEEMRQHLKTHISTYPEKDPYSKYLHFKFEKDYKLANVGEDKFRLLNWTVTPFYAKDFFKTAYEIDEGIKGTLFFRNFLYALDPKTCSVGYYNIGMSLSSPLKLKILGQAEKALRRPRVRRLAWRAINFKSRLASPQEPDPNVELLRLMAIDLLEEREYLKKYFSIGATKEIISSETDIDKLQRIITLIIYINLIK